MIKTLIENILAGKDYQESFNSLWNSILEEKLESVKMNIVLDTFIKINEGIVVGSSSKAFHKQVTPTKYDLHVTDIHGKAHKVYSVTDKDGDPKRAKRAAMTMTKELAKRYGVKSFHDDTNPDDKLDTSLVKRYGNPDKN